MKSDWIVGSGAVLIDEFMDECTVRRQGLVERGV